MKMLTCSRLNSCFVNPSQWIARGIILLFVVGNIPVQALELPSHKQSELIKPLNKKLPSTDLLAQINETEISRVTEKPGLVSTAMQWLRSTDRPGDLQIHGFVSQAYITTSDNDVFGNSDKGGSFGLTEAGLNASLRPLPRLQLSAQVLSRRAGEGNSGMPRLDYAILDYQVYSHEANQFGIRVGRLKNPFGFYNETRDVAFTRPSILLPQSIYFDRTRNLGLSSDSVQLYGDAAVFDRGTFSTQFGITLPVVDNKDTESSLLLAVRPGELNREVSYIGRGIFETNDKRLRLGISGIWLNTSYDPNNNVIDKLGPGTLQFTPVIFSAQYNTERWTLTSEYAIRPFQYNNKFSNPILNNMHLVGESYYFQGEYRFTPKWEGILRYDALYTDRSDRDGSEFVNFLKGLGINNGVAHSRFAKDITVGLRWNVTPTFMLRAEYHYINGTAWLSRLDNPSATDTDQHWHLYGIQGSYRF
ncbi:MAG: OprO/OprP family phosphate-selective porin [Nitrosomonas sp.]|nr:OprO/OprP family phosphate-selective porin [Nitrosomonas sp.]